MLCLCSKAASHEHLIANHCYQTTRRAAREDAGANQAKPVNRKIDYGHTDVHITQTTASYHCRTVDQIWEQLPDSGGACMAHPQPG